MWCQIITFIEQNFIYVFVNTKMVLIQFVVLNLINCLESIVENGQHLNTSKNFLIVLFKKLNCVFLKIYYTL